MTHEIEVFGLRIIKEPKPNKGGSTIIANFDCLANGFELTGCSLVRTRKNGLVIWMPAIEGKNRWGLSISVKDSALRHALMIAARDVYRAMGGTDAEWTPTDNAAENYSYAAARIRGRNEIKAMKEDEGLKAFLSVSKVSEHSICDAAPDGDTDQEERRQEQV